ncbi:MAG: hypothetical protein H0V64_14870 [Geodermatophilaceae bacterium]|nr:hypothetical protein [Geodermatophilaceae bacterium]
MNGRHHLTVFLGVAILAAAAACGESEGSAENPGGATGTPPTHQQQSSEEALIFGTLNGTLDCLWLEIRQERHALVLQEGSFTRAEENTVVLLGPDGSEVARTGDEVALAGGFNPGEEPCADADATGDTIVAGSVERST